MNKAGKVASSVLALAGVVVGAYLVLEPECQRPVPSHCACLTWTQPTKYTDDTDISAADLLLMRYNVYRNDRLVSETIYKTAYMCNEPTGTNTYHVTAKLNDEESLPSAKGTKLITLPPPSDGAIEAPTESAIENP
jgi:hypothetical protein